MGSIVDKLLEIARFLRNGSARLQQIQAQAEENLREQGRLRDESLQLNAALVALTQSVMQKAADVDLQFVRNSLAADIRRETGWLRDRLTALGNAVDGVHQPAGNPIAGAAKPASARAAEEAFYLALERQFRGTRDEIRARLMAYQPWLSGLPEGVIADLGCGRGEWLELLRDWGHKAVGVDLNPQFVAASRAQGLDAACEDALQWLTSQPDGSLAALTAFHLVEHLPFVVLLRLVDEARRVLAPGGRLILETPNPENLSVATQDFWLDPTHRRPLPPLLLEFLVAHAGFSVSATLRLSPPERGQDIADPTLRDLMTQGRDYAVVAHKPPAAQ
jgi:SAM-dependent methyltransferase